MRQAEAICKKSTAGDAWYTLFPPQPNGSPTIEKIRAAMLDHTEAGEKLYDNVIESIEKMQKGQMNDFQHNVSTIFGMKCIEYKHCGILAAAILVHERDLVKKLNFDNDKDRTWVGEIKKRQEFTLTIEKTYSVNSFYGIMRIIKMRDKNGNILVWKTGTGFPEYINTESAIKVKATVKEHTTYNGIKQTAVTRVTIMEEPKEAVC